MQKIKLYNDYGQKRIFECERIANGEYGIIYKASSDSCVKIFENIYQKYDLNCLKTIQTLSLESFYKIIEFLYHINGTFAGYLMTYYKSEEIDILTMPVEYTIENLKVLLEDIKTLSRNHIYAKDLGSHNVILNSNRIIVIDIDLYTFKHDIPTYNIYVSNKAIVFNIFKGLYDWSYYYYQHKEDIENIRTSTKEFFQSFNFDSVAKTLTKYKYPIDYLSSIKRKS